MNKPQIMVVEDEGLVALEIKEGLENMGYKVPYVISSGKEAVEKVMVDRPDLVLMDIRLEGTMDGVDAAQQIQKVFNVPVIFLTAHSDEKTLQKAKVAESYGYILKPFEERALKATIEIALYKAHEERKIKGNRDLLSIILRSLSEGVIVADTNGQIKFINEAAEAITKWNREQVVGKRLPDIFQIKDLEEYKSIEIPIIKTVVDGDIFSKKNVLLVTKNINEAIIDYTVAPLKNDTGITIGIVIVFKNINTRTIREDIIKRELEIPFKIQKSLLPPKNKSIQGINFNWLLYPSVFGSGDILNFFTLDDYNIGFYLLDVMGHGFAATLFSVTLHKYLSPHLDQGGILKRRRKEAAAHPKRRKDDLLPNIIPPAEVISNLNQQFYFEANNNPFFTIIYGVINTKNHKIYLAKAGHPLPLHQTKDGKVVTIESKGYAIGIYSQIEVTEKVIDLRHGDRFFIFSDGLIEVNNKDFQSFTCERLINILKANRDNSLPDLIKNLEKNILDWRGKKDFDDDIAFLAIERE